MAVALLTEATQEEVRAYLERMHAVMDQADKLDGKALERVKRLTREMQQRVLGRLAELQHEGAVQSDGSWNVFWLPQLRRAVDELAHEMAARYGTELEEFLAQAWEVGVKLADAGFGALGLRTPQHSISAVDIGIAANWSPDLIQGQADHVKQHIGDEIAVSVRTGEAPHVLAKRLAGKLTTEGTPFHSVQYRAELITRTETRRLQGMGNQHRMVAYKAANPKSRLMKHLLVAEVNGWPCPECKRLSDQGPWEVDDPRAPVVPIHPNCRCDMVPFVKGMSEEDLPSGEDKPTDEQRGASVAD